jgi:hypothetical protein
MLITPAVPSYGVGVSHNGFLIAKNLTVTGATSAGIWVQGGSASIRDSVTRGSTTGTGVLVQDDGAAPTPNAGFALIERSELSFNQAGLLVGGLTGNATYAYRIL